MADPVRFTKYEQAGAYHWVEADRRARRYNPALDARYRIILRPLGTRDTVLDLGCGDGYLLHLARASARLVVGVDSEWAAVTLADALLHEAPNARVTQGSSYELPFRAESFDAILMADVIEHLEDPAAAVRECKRVLRSDGRLLVTTPKWRPDRKWDDAHVKEFTPAELAECLEEFSRVTMTFFWPLVWSNRYSTKIGWRLVRALARYVYNPFLGTASSAPEKYGQILAVCQK